MPVSDDTGFFMPNLFDFVWLLRDSPESLAVAGLFEFRSEKSNEIKHKKSPHYLRAERRSTMARDGTKRGGARPGAGRKKKPLADKLIIR